jgi:L-arabinose isomerase
MVASWKVDLKLSVDVIAKPVMTSSEEIRNLIQDANQDSNCAGLIIWMHTFSPAKMWISGLTRLTKPFLHLHTQFNRDLPWESIDMDFMNLNQSAHGDREAAHLHIRSGLSREIVVGHWEDPEVLQSLKIWAQAAVGWKGLQRTKIARFGDNMRQVAVTEGDKVQAERVFGFTVDGYGVGDLVASMDKVARNVIDDLLQTYEKEYEVSPELQSNGGKRESLVDAARQEAGIRKFLTDGGYGGFTTTFEDLHGLNQLPGLACQRLMADGFGFAAEGDWKTAALLRFAKTAQGDAAGGCSFMEDYTYHLDPANPLVLGAHMLEICPSIAAAKPRLEIHPLGIGGKADPVRLVFDARPGPAINCSLVDLGGRFRLIANEVESVVPPAMPKLPVARAVWKCKPNFKTSAACWMYAGGAHHTVYSDCLSRDHFRLLGQFAGVEFLNIGEDTNLEEFQDKLRWNEVYYQHRG